MTIIFNRSVQDVRQDFGILFKQWHGQGRPDEAMLEVLGASFHADEDTIFGKVNHAYIAREVRWYDGMTLNVNALDKTPQIWRDISVQEDHGIGHLRPGTINSNYGFLLYHRENGRQYANIVDELLRNEHSRRAVAIYTRPSMHTDWNRDGMQDFICTNAVHYEIRDGQLWVVVQMRSNDAIF